VLIEDCDRPVHAGPNVAAARVVPSASCGFGRFDDLGVPFFDLRLRPFLGERDDAGDFGSLGHLDPDLVERSLGVAGKLASILGDDRDVT
jgi:hypothetical protein